MRIQRTPAGLIEYLKLRSQGETPDELSRIVQPVLEQETQYDMAQWSAVREPVSMSTGNIEFFQIPTNEIWKLLAVGIQRDNQTTTAVENFVFTWAVERGLEQGLDGVPFHTSPIIVAPAGAAAATRLCYAKLLERPFFLKPDQRLTIQLQYGIEPVAQTGVTFVGDFWAHIVRLSV